ncbi:nitrite reductase (NAD(P)H) small subunit [Salmonella enterica subsp. enterica]|nr:nitrite reductase (NAD(P)H) small subunit [Salmonella enterica subsp. enterica]
MSQWQNICKIDDILPGTGVCALSGGEQVAIFPSRLIKDQVFAISKYRPVLEASVCRLVTDWWNTSMNCGVASPLKKQRFRLERWFVHGKDEQFFL